MNITFSKLLRSCLVLAVSLFCAGEAAAKTLRVGITLHPYYSFVANVVGERAEVIPLIEAGSNPHNYSPQAGDMQRVLEMDVMVVNGIGHDEWAFEIIEAAGRKENLPLIYANSGVPLIPIAADALSLVDTESLLNQPGPVSRKARVALTPGPIAWVRARCFPGNTDPRKGKSAVALRRRFFCP